LDSADGHRYVTHGPEFDPTWDGSYRVLSHQLINNHCSNRAQAQSSPAPEPSVPTPPADARLRTIAIVRVLGPGIYNIEDRGTVTCPDGDAGRALHLWSRNKNPNHQLSDVIIDLQNLRFCMVRLDQRADAGLGFDGTCEVHYGDVGGYWMQTDGYIEGTLRALGIAAGHGIWRFNLLDMQFPNSLPPDAFQTPSALTDTQKENVV